MKNALSLPPLTGRLDVYGVNGSNVRLAFALEHGFAISDGQRGFNRLILVNSKSSRFCGQTTLSIQYLDPRTSRFGLITLTAWPGSAIELASFNGLRCKKLTYKITSNAVKTCKTLRRTEAHLVGNDGTVFCILSESSQVLNRPSFRNIRIYWGRNGSATELKIEKIEEFDGGIRYNTVRGCLVVRCDSIPDLLTHPTTVQQPPGASVWLPRIGFRTPLTAQNPDNFTYNEDLPSNSLTFH